MSVVEVEKGKVDPNIKKGTPKKDSKMNQVYCLGFAGKLFAQAVRAEIGPLSDAYLKVDVKKRTLRSISEGDVTKYQMEFIEHSCKVLGWTITTDSGDWGYSVQIVTDENEYEKTDTWNSDQNEITALLKARDDKDSL